MNVNQIKKLLKILKSNIGMCRLIRKDSYRYIQNCKTSEAKKIDQCCNMLHCVNLLILNKIEMCGSEGR